MKVIRAVLIGCFVSTIACAADPKPNPLPQAAEALSSFRLKPGFKIQLVAAEPQVVCPVAMAFDEDGRLFVAEMRDYPDQRDVNPHLGRIRMLEDSDDDGVFDSSSVYADNLPWPSAIACFGGGVFVAAAPEILYFKDSRKEGVADIRRVVFQGFGGEGSSLKLDALPNNFNWSPDNRIYCAAAQVGGVVSSTKDSTELLQLGRRDFSFDPVSSTLRAEAGSGESGCTFDLQGERFLMDFAQPLKTPLCPPRYRARNPLFPAGLESTDVAGAASPIFRYAPGRQAGGAQRQDGSLAGWPTRARGGCIYRGSAFPQSFVGNLFFADSAAGVIHRAILREKGLEFVAERVPDELASEFLVSRDPSFQPVQIVNGPDGALYIADLHGGNESGRIYRVVPENFKGSPTPRLGKAKPYDLVTALASPNGWHAETAARLIYEWHDPSAIGLLTNMFNNSRVPLVRFRALHALSGLGGMNENIIAKGLRDADERVREAAVLLSEKLVRNGSISDTVWNALKPLSGDTSSRVRYQLACSLGEIRRPERNGMLAQLLRRDYANRLFRTAVFSSLAEGAGEVFVSLASDGQLRQDAAGMAMLQQLLTMIGLQGRQEDAALVFDFLDRARLDPQVSFTVLHSMGEGLRRAGSGFPVVDRQNRLQPYYDQTVLATLNDTLPEPVRIAAIRLRGVSPYTERGTDDFFELLFGTGQSEGVQSAVISALARYNNPSIPTNILSHWPMLTAARRSDSVAALLSRSDGIPVVLAALQNGGMNLAILTRAQANLLRSYPKGNVAGLATQMLGPVSRERPEVVQKYKPALQMAGAAPAGRRIFLSQCASCHRLNGEGQAVGPELDPARTFGKERVLSAILEPNREVRPGYLTYIAITKGGENIVGVVTDENPKTITMRTGNGEELVYPRTHIESLNPQTWSIMPEGFEQNLPAQNMADLLEYLCPRPGR